TATEARTSEAPLTVRQGTVSRAPSSERTEPSSSTIPVNIGLHPDVVAEALDRDDVEVERLADRREAPAADDAARRRPARDLRREVHDHRVDDAVTNRAPRKRRPALDHERL